jgi:hypothetical protein
MYVKAKLADGVEIKVDITPDNLFYKCDACGKEHFITMGELLMDADGMPKDSDADDLITRLRYCPGGCEHWR